ncbi:MAG: hypothetical protein KAS38_11540, partial [Anaerolineales bacterium]|nr:hypothetical protein [Anaerolineales bacterium]
SNLNIKTPTRHLLKVICGFDTRFILKFIPQITYITSMNSSMNKRNLNTLLGLSGNGRTYL